VTMVPDRLSPLTGPITVRDLVHEILRVDFEIAPDRITDDAHLIHDLQVNDNADDWLLLAGLEEGLGVEIADSQLDRWLGLDDAAPEGAGTVGHLIAQVSALGVTPTALRHWGG
jgi:acyl carrier protein